MNAFLQELWEWANKNEMNWILFISALIIALLLIVGTIIFITIILNSTRKLSKKNKDIIFGKSETEKVSEFTKTEKTFKDTVVYKKLTNNFFTKFYKEFKFFDNNPIVLFGSLGVGYIIFFVIIYLVSTSLSIGIVLGFSYLAVWYIFWEGRISKQRKRYIKGFAMAIKIISASTSAGNSFETAVNILLARENVNKKIRSEFAQLSNHLKSNKTIDEALELFWKRNSMFNEVSMFCVTIQFFFKKGGSNLGKIMLKLEKAFDDKIESYSDIDTELGINKVLMNGLTYLYLIMLFALPLFMPTFYTDLIDQGGLGIAKCFGSLGLYFFGIAFFKKMTRNAAEG